MAFLLLLERLTPVERAVFLLHDVFGYDHAEIAEVVDKTQPHSPAVRVSRAARVQAGQPPSRPRGGSATSSPGASSPPSATATSTGWSETLAADVVVYGDGGGKAPQWSAPIAGVDRVSRLLLAGVGPR